MTWLAQGWQGGHKVTVGNDEKDKVIAAQRLVADQGFEPRTQGLWFLCSNHWANPPLYGNDIQDDFL